MNSMVKIRPNINSKLLVVKIRIQSIHLLGVSKNGQYPNLFAQFLDGKNENHPLELGAPHFQTNPKVSDR